MIRKLIISAAVLAALIYGKEANAAGPGGFARELASVAVHAQVADTAPVEQEGGDYTVSPRQEIIDVTAAVNEAIGEFDAYLDMVAASRKS